MQQLFSKKLQTGLIVVIMQHNRAKDADFYVDPVISGTVSFYSVVRIGGQQTATGGKPPMPDGC